MRTGDVLLDERQGVGDGLVVGQLDLRGDLRKGDRPQGADRLHREEGQVVPAHRARPWTGLFRGRAGELTGIAWVPAVLARKNSVATWERDPGPVRSVDRVGPRVPQGGGVVFDLFGDLTWNALAPPV